MSGYGCAACRRSFGTLELFDAHQQWDRDGEWTLTCVPPGTGLVRDSCGTWHTPEGMAKRARLAAGMAAVRSGGRPESRFPGLSGTAGTPGP